MLEKISTEELQAEIERRGKIKDEPPKQLKYIDVAPVRRICQSYIDELDQYGSAKTIDHYSIYETVMECVFGKDVWDWINKIEK